jgi:hypothetical protein
MWIKVNVSWHLVAWTDPNYVSVTGEMLHKTRCGLTKIRPQYPDFPFVEKTCERCLRLIAKDAS